MDTKDSRVKNLWEYRREPLHRMTPDPALTQKDLDELRKLWKQWKGRHQHTAYRAHTEMIARLIDFRELPKLLDLAQKKLKSKEGE
jgi:hypothetical protein